MGFLADVINVHARRAPNQLALVQRPTDRHLTYKQLADAARTTAEILTDGGVGPGDRVLLGVPSNLEHLVAYVACSLLGAVIVPLHHDAQSWEIERYVVDAQPGALLASEDFAERAVGMDTALSLALLTEGGGFRRVRGARGVTRVPPTSGGDRDAVLAYTSGTTGQAKGVRITESNLAHLFPHQCINHRIPPYGRSLVGMPLSFVAACMDMVLAHLYSGSTVIFHEYFDAELLLDSITVWRPNFVWMTTPMLDDVASLQHERPLDSPGLLTFHHGASAIPDALMQWLFESVGNRLTEGYGMTEYSGGLITAMCPSDFDVDEDIVNGRLQSIGRSLIGAELAIVDEGGTVLPAADPGEGEIWVRGPGLSPGYWARNEPIGDEDGWFRTGDVARRDENGYFFLRGRIRDTIQSGGATVHATEVESCLRAALGVVDVAAFGMAHPRWGEAVAVAVVRRNEAELDEQTVLSFCAKRLSGFKRPRSVYFVERLPRTCSGKVQKTELRGLITGDVTNPAQGLEPRQRG